MLALFEKYFELDTLAEVEVVGLTEAAEGLTEAAEFFLNSLKVDIESTIINA